jgi:CubicO group peptidase (beta-lactamase class C family)
MNRDTLPLLLFTIVLLAAPAAFAQTVINGKPQSPGYTGLIAESEKYFSDKLETDKIVGLSAAVIMDGKVVWKKGFGFSDRLSKTPMTVNTIVNIGSVTKTFTSLAIMQLMEKGLVDIDKPLQNYLPAFHPKTRPGMSLKDITIRSVLTHTSGIQSDIWKNSDLETGKYTDVAGFINDTYLTYPAGLAGLYSNSGYNILGNTIKEISKEDYATYVHRHILAPLGMVHSGFAMDSQKNRSRIYAYGKEFKEYELRDIASGGLYMDMDDFTKYALALLNAYNGKPSKVIRQKTIRDMFTLQNATVPLETNKKGLGWFMFKNDSAFAMYHAGSAGFAHAKLLLFPSKNAAVIVMTNTAEGGHAAEEFCFNLLPRFGLSIPDLFPAPKTGDIHEAQSTVNLPDSVLEKHTGNYGESGSYSTVRVNNHQLEVTEGNDQYLLKPLTADEFVPYRITGKDTIIKKNSQRYFFKDIRGYHFLIQRIREREYNLGYRMAPVDTTLWNKRTGLYEQFGYQLLIGDSKFKSVEIYLSKDHVLMCRLKTMGSTSEIPLDVIARDYALTSGLNSGFGGFNVHFRQEEKYQVVDFAGITFRKEIATP